MYKRGLSSIVASVLVVLVTVAASSLLWFGIYPMLSSNLDLSRFDTHLEVVKGQFTVYDSDNNIADVQIAVSGNKAPDYLQVIFILEDGNEYLSTRDAPGINQSANYIYDFSNSNLEKPKYVSVAPIFKIDNKNVLGYRIPEVELPWKTGLNFGSGSGGTGENPTTDTTGDGLGDFTTAPNDPGSGDPGALPSICTDADDDGYSLYGGSCGLVDCNDNDVNIHPGVPEICNGIDDNCVGGIDEVGCNSGSHTISDCSDLQNINFDLNGYYDLTTDLICNNYFQTPNPPYNPIGDESNPFQGEFNGNGHSITLSLNLHEDSAGLFSVIGTQGYVHDLNLIGNYYSGYDCSYTTNPSCPGNSVGGLAGKNYGLIDTVSIDGTVIGTSSVGGLVGSNYGTVNDSSSNAYVYGYCKDYYGGLVGYNEGEIINSYSTTGLFIYSEHTSSYCYGKGNSNYIGGLVGGNYGSITDSYSSITDTSSGYDISGYGYIGGLIGENGGIINSNSYYCVGISVDCSFNCNTDFGITC